MKNETSINLAIEILKELNIEKVESVEIGTYKHDDGSKGFDISINYKKGE